MKKCVSAVAAILFILSTFCFASCSGHVHKFTYYTQGVPCVSNYLKVGECECGYRVTETLAPIGHDYGYDYKYDETYHWYECSRCGDKTRMSEHDIGYYSKRCYACGYEDDNPFRFSLNADGKSYTLSGVYEDSFDFGAGEYTLPSEYRGLPVTAIADHALSGKNIVNLVIPDSVKSIGNYAFWYCGGLTRVIADGVTEIGSSAFYEAESLTTASFKSLESVGNSAFDGCVNLTNADFGKSIILLGNYSFENCGITQITLAEGLTEVPSGAFYDSKLITVRLPRSLRAISGHAFGGHCALKTIYYSGTLNEWENVSKAYYWYGNYYVSGRVVYCSNGNVSFGSY